MASSSLTTRKMSDRHEQWLVDLLGGTRTRNSGAVWSDPGDGHQTGLDQHYRFGWDGKSTLGKSVSVTRSMLDKLRLQSRGLLPMLPLRFYANDRLTEVSEDWIAVEAEVFSEILADANEYQRQFGEESDVSRLHAPLALVGLADDCPHDEDSHGINQQGERVCLRCTTGEHVCEHCSSGREEPVAYPCPTLLALGYTLDEEDAA